MARSSAVRWFEVGPTREELSECFDRAADLLLRGEEGLLRTANPPERSIAARFFLYLEPELAKVTPKSLRYTFDLDYERAEHDPKRLAAMGAEEKRATAELGKKIIPDMLLHRRFSSAPDANYLAVEVKVKKPSRRREEHDLAKLRLLTGVVPWVEKNGNLLRTPDDPGATPPEGALERPARIKPYRFGVMLRLHLLLPEAAPADYCEWIDPSS